MMSLFLKKFVLSVKFHLVNRCSFLSYATRGDHDAPMQEYVDELQAKAQTRLQTGGISGFHKESSANKSQQNWRKRGNGYYRRNTSDAGKDQWGISYIQKGDRKTHRRPPWRTEERGRTCKNNWKKSQDLYSARKKKKDQKKHFLLTGK